MTAADPIPPILPEAITIVGARPLVRTIHRDRRGLLVETLRKDDRSVDGARFAMSYTSVTMPGKFRDIDRWHVHRIQTDRFVVTMGTMMLALLDARVGSPTQGRLEVIPLEGARSGELATPSATDSTAYLVPIPPGVYHSIGNLSSEPFVLQNFPTELYDPSDEGRVPFVDVPVGSAGAPFAWDRVAGGGRVSRG